MYLTAQRVRSPGGGAMGVNVFIYRDTSHVFPGDISADIPERCPGHLVASAIAVPPGGNEVLSFLDVITDEGATNSDIKGAFTQLVSVSGPIELPLSRQIGHCRFVFNVIAGLQPLWKQELEELFESAVSPGLLGEAGVDAPR